MTNPIPQTGLIPHLVVNNAQKAIDFYKKAFGAKEVMSMPGPDGKRIMHAELTLDGAAIYLCDDFPEMCGGKSRTPVSLKGTPVTIHRYVKDCDAAIEKAKKAGATVSMPPQDMFWGDRYGQVTDPFGHVWSIATHVKDLSPEEMEEAAAGAFS
jgi:PhnB protein